jgi:hypothetical protein
LYVPLIRRGSLASFEQIDPFSLQSMLARGELGIV